MPTDTVLLNRDSPQAGNSASTRENARLASPLDSVELELALFLVLWTIPLAPVAAVRYTKCTVEPVPKDKELAICRHRTRQSIHKLEIV